MLIGCCECASHEENTAVTVDAGCINQHVPYMLYTFVRVSYG